MNEWSFLNPTWWNSRWLPSSSCVRMNEFESDWISLSQSQSGVRLFLSESERRKQGVWIQHGRIQDGRIQDGCHHQVNQIELVWVRVLCKMADSKMAEFKMGEFKMAAIIKLIRLNYFELESEWRESVLDWIWKKIRRCLNLRWRCLNPTWQNSRWLPSSSWVRMNEWSFLNPTWWNSRWLPSSSWVRMNEWRFFCANGGNQSWQVGVSLRGKTKVAESKMVKFKMAEFKMAAIIKLSQNEWVWVSLN